MPVILLLTAINSSDTINVNSDLMIGFGGTLTSRRHMMYLSGDWLNLGTYTYADGTTSF